MLLRDGILSSLYQLIADFGEAYSGIMLTFFNTLFRRPLLFIFTFFRRFIRLIFRTAVIFFAPADISSEDFSADVIRCTKICIKTLFTQPGSFPAVSLYYIKRAFSRYSFSIKNVLLWLVPLLVLAGAAVGGNALSESLVALKITVDGEILGFVESEEDYIEAEVQVRQLLGDSFDPGATEVSYSLVIVGYDKITDKDTLCTRLIGLSDADAVRACGVYADGVLIGIVYSENDARAVLDEQLQSARADERNYTVSFAEEVTYEYGYYSEDSVTDKDGLRALVTKGKKTYDVYTLRSGDTLQSVAEKFSMTEEELYALNGISADSEAPSEGDTLTVTKYVPLLTLKEIRTEITGEPIAYDTVKIESAALYSGSSRVLSSGKAGLAQVTSFVTYVDGEKVSSREVNRLTINDAVPEILQIGTKSLDEAYSNSMGGIFLWPIVGAYGINSDYGYRWGKLHAGIDLGMGGAAGTSLGKDIIAVAQGTVIVAGVHSSYGYYVIIDHGNGLQTLYAHCYAGSLAVTPGQVVVAGQPIAKVGSTGYSTGPHLHFEVRVNGNRVNPRPYLGI